MAARNDFRCTYCGNVREFVGVPEASCPCGLGDWVVVFTTTPQVRTQHTSCLGDVGRFNNQQVRLAEEEDCTPGTEGYKDMQEITHRVEPGQIE